MGLPDVIYLHPQSALDIYSTKDGEGRVAYYRQDVVDKTTVELTDELEAARYYVDIYREKARNLAEDMNKLIGGVKDD